MRVALGALASPHQNLIPYWQPVLHCQLFNRLKRSLCMCSVDVITRIIFLLRLKVHQELLWRFVGPVSSSTVLGMLTRVVANPTVTDPLRDVCQVTRLPRRSYSLAGGLSMLCDGLGIVRHAKRSTILMMYCTR